MPGHEHKLSFQVREYPQRVRLHLWLQDLLGLDAEAHDPKRVYSD